MKRFLKIIRNIIGIIIILFGLLLALGKVFEKDIVNQSVSLINKKIKMPISVDKITLNIWRQFPYLTIELHNVRVKSSSNLDKTDFKDFSAENFLHLEKILLSFNAKSVFNNVYELNSIILKNGNINIFVDKQGNNNYTMLQQSKADTSAVKNFKILLRSFKLNDVNFHFNNAYKEQQLKLFADDFQVKGALYKQQYSAETKGSIQIKEYNSKYLNFKPQHKTSVKTELSINNDTILISNAKLKTKGIAFNAKGKVVTSKQSYVDIQLTGNNIELESLLRFLPNTAKFRKEVSAKGILATNTHIWGKWTAKYTPKIKSNYKLKHSSITYKKKDFDFENINVVGSYSNYKQPVISFSDFSVKVMNSVFKGKASIPSFKRPKLSINAGFNINLKDVAKLFSNKEFKLQKGTVEGQITCSGLVKQNMTKNDWLKINYNINANVNNASFNLTNPKFDVRNLNTQISANNRFINANSLSAICLDIPISGSAEIYNVPKIVANLSKNVNINSNLNIGGSLNYDNIKHLFASDSKSNKKAENNINVAIKSNILVKEFIYDKFVSSNISGSIIYRGNSIDLQNLNFYSCGGNIKSDTKFTMSDNGKIKVNTESKTHKVNIDRLFTSFNNFNQDFITDNNLRGKVNSDIKGSFTIKKGTVQQSSLNLEGYLKVTDGELMNFEPTQKLASFSKIEEFNHLKFATLENNIVIKRNKISIPRMDIVSNAMDVNISGNQILNGDFEYHIKLLLSEMIGGKNKALKRRQSKFGTIEDDGKNKTTIYLLAQGKNGKTKIKFDKMAFKQFVKKEKEKEKTEIKRVLKKEFGWFKKEKIPEKKDTTQNKHFEIEWDEE